MEVAFTAARVDGQKDTPDTIMDFNKNVTDGIKYKSLSVFLFSELGLGAYDASHKVDFDFETGTISVDGNVKLTDDGNHERTPTGKMRFTHALQMMASAMRMSNTPEQTVYIIGWKSVDGAVQCLIDHESGVVKMKKGEY